MPQIPGAAAVPLPSAISPLFRRAASGRACGVRFDRLRDFGNRVVSGGFAIFVMASEQGRHAKIAITQS
jgi:hypothetical protein